MIKAMCKYFLKKISYISPEANSKLLYRMKTGKKLNLKNPKKFNEKLMFLKLNVYSKSEKASQCSDKYAVREYVKSHNLEHILNDIYGVYTKPKEINWEELPNKFVLKCTHGCQYNILCTEKTKLDIKKTTEKLNKWLKDEYGYKYSELHYLKIKPRIICEKFLETKDGNIPEDYKIYCFNGNAKIVLVCTERKGKVANKYFFDTNWKRLEMRDDKNTNNDNIPKPEKLEEMIKYAEMLSKDFPFVRVDFYIVNNKIYFGELTFTPAACCGEYREEADKMLANMLDIGGEL